MQTSKNKDIESEINAKLRKMSQFKELNKSFRTQLGKNSTKKQLKFETIKAYLKNLQLEEREKIFVSQQQPFVFLLLKMYFVKTHDKQMLFSLKPCQNWNLDMENHKQIFNETQIGKSIHDYFKPIHANCKNTLNIFDIEERILTLEDEFLSHVLITSSETSFDTLTFSYSLIKDVD